jgi:ubiquinone/menaquinone biosynthesis C-methylase UbiE
MVGENGRVFAVDLQDEMLEITRKLARKKGVLPRITLRRCEQDDLGLADLQVDFALAFYVVHEIPDKDRFMRQAAGMLKPKGKFMLIEPKHHVKGKDYERIIAEARSAGLEPVGSVKVALSRGMLFSRRKVGK